MVRIIDEPTLSRNGFFIGGEKSVFQTKLGSLLISAINSENLLANSTYQIQSDLAVWETGT